jgi:hypothetical protein
VLSLLGVLGAVLVVLLVALVVLGLVAWVAVTVDVNVGFDVLVTGPMLIDVDVSVLVLIIARRRWALAIAFNPDVTLLDAAGSSVLIALDVDLAFDALRGRCASPSWKTLASWAPRRAPDRSGSQ